VTDANDHLGGVLPDEPDLEVLHQRQYQVRAWRVDAETALVRGAVEDRKPGHLWPGDPDEWITFHHMIVDLRIVYPELVIREARVRLETHPHPGCPEIARHYRELEGLSIARGFTHKVRELFGGPRGCTHTTALLQAMAPVAVQCSAAMGNGSQIEPTWMRDTCHMWSEDGELWPVLKRGERVPMPIPMVRRLVDAGVDPDRWSERPWPFKAPGA
jgi:hypothetical protein